MEIELTKEWQMLKQEFLGNSHGDLYIRIYARYTNQDIDNLKTTVQYEARAYFSGGWIQDDVGNGNVSGTGAPTIGFSNMGRVNSGEKTLASTEGVVYHDPSTGDASITASATLSLPSWTDWGRPTKTATGSATLPNIHRPPIINTATMVETNSALTALNLPDTTIVSHLSQKTITLSATTYDDATANYRLRHLNSDYSLPSSSTYQASAVFNADYTQHDVAIGSGKANLIQDIKDSLNGTATDWVLVEINGTPQKPDGIPYEKPQIEKTSTHIKRLSGGGTALIENKAVLNLVGTIYKANDIIGNYNSCTVAYKIWRSDQQEPARYEVVLDKTIEDGVVTVEDYELSNLDYTKVYYYKLLLQDRFGNMATIDDGILSTGQSVWTEYPNRVDFPLKLTVKGYNPFEYSENETICGVWKNSNNEEVPIYRKVLNIGSYNWNNAVHTFAHNISNIDMVIKAEWKGYYNNLWYCSWDDLTAKNITVSVNDVIISCASSGTTFSKNYIILEYTKASNSN